MDPVIVQMKRNLGGIGFDMSEHQLDYYVSDVKEPYLCRLLRGLKKEFNISKNEYFDKELIYIGSNHSGIHKYIQDIYEYELPETYETCACGVKIVENCYIINKNDFKKYPTIGVVGNKCMERFGIIKVRNRCYNCGDAHKNRKGNVCNSCRSHVCWYCGRNSPKYEYDHKYGNKTQCSSCYSKLKKKRNKQYVKDKKCANCFKTLQEGIICFKCGKKVNDTTCNYCKHNISCIKCIDCVNGPRDIE